MNTKRSELNLIPMVDDFLAITGEEDPRLFKALNNLDIEGKRNLGGIVGRFDRNGSKTLDSKERLMARRILGRLHKPTSNALAIVNKILDYLDLNENSLLEPEELELGIEILEKFSKVDSQNETLSELELGMLYAVLRYLDRNDNHVLDPEERHQLHKALDNVNSFLKTQKLENPYLQEVLNEAGRA